MADIICIGELLIDFLPGETPDIFIRHAGGAPANVAIAAGRNGLQSAMITKVGNDDFGTFLFDTLRQENVEILSPRMTDEALTTLAFVTLTPGGERSFVFGRKPGADMLMSKDDIDPAQIGRTVIVHAGSFSLSAPVSKDAVVYALQTAHEAKRLVSFDINYRNVAWNDDKQACADEVKKLLPCVDLLKVSDEETDMLGGDEALLHVAKENDIALVVITRGPKGADCLFRGKTLHCPGFRAEQVADTTGAGDAFWGGFLSALFHAGVRTVADLTDDIIRDAARYGNVSGSLCVREKGAIASLPTRAQVERFLADTEDAG